MLTLQIWNISDLAPVSDYHYALYVNREQIAAGTVNGHKRADGWPVLVKKIAEGHMEVAEHGLTVCGFLRDRDGAICPSLSGHKGQHKFVKIRPAKR